VLYLIEPRSHSVRRLGIADLRSHSETISVARCGDTRVPNGFELFNSVLLMIGHVFAYQEGRPVASS
jgi:hypothetical protein